VTKATPEYLAFGPEVRLPGAKTGAVAVMSARSGDGGSAPRGRPVILYPSLMDTEQPLHLQGRAVSRHDPWYMAWRRPRPGVLVCRLYVDGPNVCIEMDEYMGLAYLEAFGRDVGAPLLSGKRVIAAAFVLGEENRGPIQ